ncbi:MAG: HNH endonuclease, partial [Acidimicrobiales bacterium]|nr:HNH endonuclease [Acidimicrobiales bacterium]
PNRLSQTPPYTENLTLSGAGPVPESILNDLSPDTRITGALFAGPGQPLWLGRGRRLASAAQQLAVAIRDRGCVLCGAAMHRCRYHHVDEWDADHGTTDVPNLAALCNDCHNTLHKRGQRLRRDASTRHWVTQRRPEQPDQPPRRAHPADPASPQAPRAQVSQRDPP